MEREMEKIRVGQGETLHGILSIAPVSGTVMQIVFADTEAVPKAWGDITLYTSGGDEATTLHGYDTVYRDEGQTVYLSNDGSVYTAPETPEGPVGPPEPYVPTLGEAKAAKRRELSAACQRSIYDGVDVGLSDGTVGHFSLTIEDQLNLFGKQSQLAAGADRLEYHADGQPCRYYPAADMRAVIQAAMRHVSYHTTYCNALNMWVAGCGTIGEVGEIFYGANVPEEYRGEVLAAYLEGATAMADAKGGVGDEAMA